MERKINLPNFAARYIELKAKNIIPMDIAEIIMQENDCKTTCYYNALRECREKGLIVDSFEENTRERIIREKNGRVYASATLRGENRPRKRKEVTTPKEFKNEYEKTISEVTTNRTLCVEVPVVEPEHKTCRCGLWSKIRKLCKLVFKIFIKR